MSTTHLPSSSRKTPVSEEEYVAPKNETTELLEKLESFVGRVCYKSRHLFGCSLIGKNIVILPFPSSEDALQGFKISLIYVVFLVDKIARSFFLKRILYQDQDIGYCIAETEGSPGNKNFLDIDYSIHPENFYLTQISFSPREGIKNNRVFFKEGEFHYHERGKAGDTYVNSSGKWAGIKLWGKNEKKILFAFEILDQLSKILDQSVDTEEKEHQNFDKTVLDEKKLKNI